MANRGHENLVPQSERTKAEQRKIAKKGGKASGAARRERKLLRDELLALLSTGDTQEKMCLALVRQAQRGNIKAFEVVRDTVGERPGEELLRQAEIEPDPLSTSLEHLAGDIDEED